MKNDKAFAIFFNKKFINCYYFRININYRIIILINFKCITLSYEFYLNLKFICIRFYDLVIYI